MAMQFYSANLTKNEQDTQLMSFDIMIIAWALFISAYCTKSTNRTKKKDHAKLVSEPFTACGVSHWSPNSAYKSE